MRQPWAGVACFASRGEHNLPQKVEVVHILVDEAQLRCVEVMPRHYRVVRGLPEGRTKPSAGFDGQR